jgi:hypothetical protein
MVRVNREGFTSLSSSEDAKSDPSFLKYDPAYSYTSSEAAFLLTLRSIIFVHGLRGHPQETWMGSLDIKGEPHDDSTRRKDLKSFFGLGKAKPKPTETGELKPPTLLEVF